MASWRWPLPLSRWARGIDLTERHDVTDCVEHLLALTQELISLSPAAEVE
jgi:hypothetical protein